MDMRGCVWVRESFSSHDKWYIKLLSECNHKIRVQECYGGVAMSHLWHHVMSCDIISMIGGGVGCVTEGGVCHGEFKVDNFHMIILQILHKPAWNLVKLLCKYSYLISSQFQALQSDKIHDIRQFKYSNFKSFHLLFDVGGPPSIMAGSQSNFQIPLLSGFM